MKKNRLSSFVTCQSCSSQLTDRQENEKKGPIRAFFSNICIGRLALFLGAVYIVVSQLFLVSS